MERCEFYNVETKVIRDQRIRSNRAGRPRDMLEMSWCAHPKHSPVDCEDATRMLGTGTRLKCQGDPCQCPLTPDQLNDM